MSTGTFPVLVKNTKQLFPGLAAYATSIGPNLGTLKKIKDRQWTEGPKDYKEQKELWDECYWKKGICQKKNMWVDQELSSVVSRKELAELIQWKVDSWKMATISAPVALTGGYGLLAAPLWLANDTWQPSCMPQTPEALAQWREAQDLYRYKYAPAAITAFKWWLESCCHIPEKYHAGWEEIFEKNDVRRDASKVAFASKMYECVQPFTHIRRQQARMIGRAMGIPTFPTWSKICLHARIREYWELIFNEDFMVRKQNLLAGMSDDEVQDFAWRRYLAPYDKKLNREQLEERINDYWVVLGADFMTTGQTSNMFLVTSYVFGFYNEPAFLEADISELDGNDFEGMKEFGKDLYLQRLEFENGPLRDQVEALGQKKNAEIEAKLKALQ